MPFTIFQSPHEKIAVDTNADSPEVEEIEPNDLQEDPDIVYVKTSTSSVESLVIGLTKFRSFTASIEELSSYVGLVPATVKGIVQKNSNFFSFDKFRVVLKHKLKVCRKHCSPEGCKNRISCRDLHICSEFVSGKCPKSPCIFGHSWYTGHNMDILKDLQYENLSQEILQKITQTFETATSPDSAIDICRDYNGSGCNTENCPRLHICSSFFSYLVRFGDRCTEACSLNHYLLSPPCLRVLIAHGIQTNETQRDIALAVMAANPSLFGKNTKVLKRKMPELTEMQQSVWSHHLYGSVATEEICFKSVMSKCPMEESGCSRLHSSSHFHWQISEDGNCWLNLRLKQVKCVERAYCNPFRNSVDLPRLDPATLEPHLKGLFLILGRESWAADFSSMTLVSVENASKKLYLRRLCTESAHNKDKSIKPSNFVWYFVDVGNNWVSYGKADSSGNSGLTSSVSSEDIEARYKVDPKGSMMFLNSRYSYLLDFRQMCQTNQQTNTARTVRRRPELHLQEEDMEDLPEDWKVVFPVQHVQRITLEENSSHYKKVIGLLNHHQQFNCSWIKIERIQNLFLWRAYQNKAKEMNSSYGNYNVVDVRYLFHGTTADSVNSICHENFDWRLHGASNGQAFGRGTYFSTDPHLAAKYSKPDSHNHKYLFVALVAVGTMTLGNSSMVRPPINPGTNLPFNSTSNAVLNPSIIVKYDKQEYYPHFLVTYI